MSVPLPAIVWAALVAGGDRADPPRLRMLESIARHAACYHHDLTEEQRRAILEAGGALPAAELADQRFASQASVWTGEALIGPSNQSLPTRLTYSFPIDGIQWGITESAFGVGPNALNASFTSHFGAGNVDRGRELLRQSIASWRRYAGLTYNEVADDNASMSTDSTRTSLRGDIRLGAFDYGNIGVLAFNYYPAFGGDVCINISYMNTSFMLSAFSSYRYIRNTMGHEHGHGLGARHTVPCIGTKLMEPFITSAFEMVQIDDRRGATRNYGDRFSGNHSAGTARNFGSLTTPILKSVIQRDLAINGSSGPGNTDEDWFRFTLGSSQPVTITVTPTGGSYTAGEQLFDCEGSTGTINAAQAGNLNVQLIAADGVTVLFTAAVAAAGATETLNAGTLGAGNFYVRVYDVGPNLAANQVAQLYDLTIRVAAAKAPPEVIAGINKRILANSNCFFMGDLNSAATEGTLALPQAFDWDLDGDGAFETNDIAQPNRQYVSNGVYPVTLRVTDSNGMSATDTINVSVFGATTNVTMCAPATGAPGATVPVTLTGTNFKNVTHASMITLSGSGVTVIGTPTSNTLGTTLSGISFQIASNAATGLRSITVSNADGTGVGFSMFNISATPPIVPGPFNLSAPANGAVIADTAPVLTWSASTGAQSYNVKIDDDPMFVTPIYNANSGFTSAIVPPGLLEYKAFYHWRVTAINTQGSTVSTPGSSTFRTGACEGDANYDRVVNFADITKVLEFWGSTFAFDQSGEGDANDDDTVSFADITKVLENWGATCF